MRIDGDPNAEEFAFTADSRTMIGELRIVVIASQFKFGQNDFGKNNALSSGLLIEIVKGAEVMPVDNVTINDDLVVLPESVVNTLTNKDVLTATYRFNPGILLQDGEKIRVTVRDDLTRSAHALQSVRACVVGSKE